MPLDLFALLQVQVANTPETVVQLNGSTLLAMTGIMGVMSTAIGVLWKNDRDRTAQQLKDKDVQLEQARKERDEVKVERDFYRDGWFRELSRGEHVLSTAEEATRAAGRALGALR